MVGVICLNCTNRKQVKRVLPTFFSKWATAESFLYSQQPKPCAICYRDEAKGKSSKRIEVNEQFKDWDYVVNGMGYM